MPTPERVIETIRAECLDPTVIQRSAASRSDAPDLCRALQPRATPSRPRPRPSTSRSVGPDPRQSARRSPTGSARWADPRVSRRRRVIESGFPIPTGSLRPRIRPRLGGRLGRGRLRCPPGGGPARPCDAVHAAVFEVDLDDRAPIDDAPRTIEPSVALEPGGADLGPPRSSSRRWHSECRTPQRITGPIWWYPHTGSHSAEPLRLGKQTLCQLSYSRSGSRSRTASA